MTISPQLFVEAGQALFGDDWKNPLADALGMNSRTVRRIASAAREGEDYPINPGLAPALAELLRSSAAAARADAETAAARLKARADAAERLAAKLSE